MPRSTYIYLAVQDYPCLSYNLKFSTTVKKELISWAKKHNTLETSYYRFKDSKFEEPVNISKQINEEIG